MKKALIILIVASGLMACKKTSVAPAVLGKWELARMYGGFSYRDSTYASGNGNIYQFNSNGTYTHFTKGVQDVQGTYQYKKNAIQFSGTSYDALILDNNTPGDMVTLSGPKLTIGTTVTDGIASDYQKISN